MNNPFVFGSASSGDQFTDRVKDSERLLANFQHGINTILISPRRWGKTSLVHKVSKLAQSKELRIVNIDAFACRSAEDFYMLLATELIKQTASKWEEWAENSKNYLAALVPKISFGVDPNTDFSLSLDFSNNRLNDEVLNLPQKIAAEKGIKIVICIDEFQQIADFHEAAVFQKKLRTIWQHQKDVSYCLYGSKKHLMAELFSLQSKPFYKFGDVLFLEKISTNDWIPFLVERFQSTKKIISEELAKKLCEIVENHSSYVQQLAWIVWLNTEREATDENLKQGIEDLFKQNGMLYYRYIESLSGYQISFLHALADGINSEFNKNEILQKYHLGTSGNVKRIKESLEKKELIDINGKQVHFNDPVFLLWFKINMRRF